MNARSRSIRRWVSLLVALALSLGIAGGPSSLLLTGVGLTVAEAESHSALPASQRLAPGEVPAGLSGDEWTGMQEQMRLAQYQVAWQVRDGAWAYRAPNPAQGFDTAFAPDGFTAAAYTDGQPAWRFGLRLAAYGDQAMSGEIAAGGLSGDRARVEYRWTEGVTEWYENRPEGVEHGLTLHAPPPSGSVTLDFALSGDLRAEPDGSGGLRLRDASGTALLRYDGLAVTDATGRPLPADLFLSPERDVLSIVMDATGAAYPLIVDPLLHSEVAILHASDAQAGDWFGISVAVSGDVIVVGALLENGGVGDPLPWAGAAYVFERGQGGADSWGEVCILRASDAQAGDYFGNSVGASGDVIVVGAYGKNAAYVFQRDQGGADSWGEVRILHASDAQPGDYFGSSVATSGDVIVVGAWWEDGGPGDPRPDSGAAYVFQRDQGGPDNWGEVRILRASDAQWNDQLGAVAVSGDVIVVGAWWEDGGPGDPRPDSGAAYVFQRDQGGPDNWGEVRILRASDAQEGDWFGATLTVSGDVIVVGAAREDGGPGSPLANSGAAYVFQRDWGGPDNWGQARILRASDAWADDYFGSSVAVSGDVLVIGAVFEDGDPGNPCPDCGAVYVFQRDRGGPGNWGQVQILHASDAQTEDFFGVMVAISGDVIVVGAYGEDGGGSLLTDAGAAYVFQRSESDDWLETAPLRASDAQASDLFGVAAAISGDMLIVGACDEDGGPGDPLWGAGAAYVFERDQDEAGSWGQARILRAPDAQAEDHFGCAVGISGDVIVVGAYDEDGGPGDPLLGSGAAYVFQRNQGGADSWGWVQTLHASDAQAYDTFGYSAAIAGDVIVVGAEGEDGGPGDPAFGSGAAYVFHRNQGGADNWGQIQVLHACDAQQYDGFGRSVAISGDGIVVGAYGEDGGPGDPLPNSGAAYVFQRDQGGPGNWGELHILHASDAQTEDYFGLSVAVSGDVIAIGAPSEDGGPADPLPDSGAAYVFQRDQGGAGNWGEVQTIRASDVQMADCFGGPVAISGDVIVVGAPCEDGGPGDPLPASGAVYVFQAIPNRPPVADDDAFTVDEDSLNNPLDVLDGDLDPDGDPLIIFAVGTPDQGGSALNGGTVVIYTPAANFFGSEVFTYTVADGRGGFDTATVMVTVTSVNDPPVADAGPDQGVDTLALVTLDGSGSFDPDGDLPLAYLWVQTGGPAVTLSDPAAVGPTFTAPGDPTVLTFTLTVSDSLGLPAIVPDEVVIVVEPYRIYLLLLRANP